MSWAYGACSRWALAAVALVILAPDVVHALRHSQATSATWGVVPLLLAMIATLSGLRRGRSLGKLAAASRTGADAERSPEATRRPST